MITNSSGPTQQAREGNRAELTAEAQAKKARRQFAKRKLQ
jgi:hypothetical protein